MDVTVCNNIAKLLTVEGDAYSGAPVCARKMQHSRANASIDCLIGGVTDSPSEFPTSASFWGRVMGDDDALEGGSLDDIAHASPVVWYDHRQPRLTSEAKFHNILGDVTYERGREPSRRANTSKQKAANHRASSLYS